MVEEEDKKAKKPDGPTCDRALLCPEEWQDAPNRKVLGEYHKEGLPEGLLGVDEDLKRFEEFWSAKGSVNVQSEYHKEGAPYLEEIDGQARRDPQPEEGTEAPVPIAEPQRPKEKEPSEDKMPEPESGRMIDLATAEVISYALFRAIFGTGVHIPLKREGLVDADITVKRNDIFINTNEFYAAVPELSVWKIVYSHKGKPILEFGRGVQKGMKVHRWNSLMLGIVLWRQMRAVSKAKERAKKEKEKQQSKERSAG